MQITDDHGLAVFLEDRLLGAHGILVLVGALSGIILEQVGQHLRAGQVVDSDNLITLGIKHLAESKTTDAAKAIDSNSNHWKSPPKTLSSVSLAGYTLSIVPKFAFFFKAFPMDFEKK